MKEIFICNGIKPSVTSLDVVYHSKNCSLRQDQALLAAELTRQSPGASCGGVRW